jgi:MFS transporter, Spinster family, sphingosine-1-phosphate transporter
MALAGAPTYAPYASRIMTSVASRDLARTARTGLLVLTLINLFNYLDRYIVPVLGETLRHSDLHITDTQFGLLGSGFIIVYMLAAPFFGMLGDRGSRPRLIALGVAVWSVATAVGGLAWNFASLFLARSAVGIGEAAYGTISPSLLSDYYAREYRGRVFAVFYAMLPIGTALGYIVAGQMDVHFGWRSAFFVAGVPGLVLAALALRLHDPPRGVHDPEYSTTHAHPGPGALGSYRALARNRPYVLTVLGFAAYTFALGGMAFFMPKFLMRVRGLPEASVGVWFGLILAVTGLGGTLLGGWIGDRLLRVRKQAYLWLSGISTLVAVPITFVALTSSTPAIYWGATTVAAFLLFVSTSPVNAVIINLVPPTMRATAVAVSIFVIHILGDVPSPTLLGAVSDARGLDQAVLIIPVAILVSGAIWTYAAWRES